MHRLAVLAALLASTAAATLPRPALAQADLPPSWNDGAMRAGVALTPDIVARYFTGRRPADMFTEVEIAAGRTLPKNFAARVTAAILRRFRDELRATAHVDRVLSWLRGPKCVASASPLDRVRVALESPDLIRYFEPYLYSGNDVRHSKPAPDLFLHVARKMHVEPARCIVVEDSPVGVAAGAAGMMVIGFAGNSDAGGHLDHNLRLAGAHSVITDMRALPGAVIDLRGW